MGVDGRRGGGGEGVVIVLRGLESVLGGLESVLVGAVGAGVGVEGVVGCCMIDTVG